MEVEAMPNMDALTLGSLETHIMSGGEILGFWNRVLDDKEIAQTREACEHDNKLARAFDLWVDGHDEEAKALLDSEDHVLLDGLIIWKGKCRGIKPA